MTTQAADLVRGTAADLAFVMATERREGYDALVGRWDAARHQSALADGRHAYFIARDASGARAGFAILRDWGSAERVTLVKRLAVREPGRGLGRTMLRGVVDLVFTQTEAYRVWLGVFPDNVRAQRSYAAAGFVAEGVARGSAYFAGVHRDELVMAILRPDWIARRAEG